MLSGMRQEQERLCGRDYLMIKSWFHADSQAEPCMTLPFPAAEESIASSSPWTYSSQHTLQHTLFL